MYNLITLSDCIRIDPQQFHLPVQVAISEELNKKFSNKVVVNAGLAIALWDITDLKDSYILPGDGGHYTPVTFRILFFRPPIKSALCGKVKSCCRDGVFVTLSFFDDIFIPKESLQHPSRFDEAEQVWVWEYTIDDSTHDLFMDVGEPIRFRVIAEKFEETLPAGPDSGSEREKSERVPYSIIGSINEPGLGLESWWNQQMQEEGEEDANSDPPSPSKD